MLPMQDNIEYDPQAMEEQGGIVFFVPIGQASNIPLLGNLGPKIPIRFHVIGDVQARYRYSHQGIWYKQCICRSECCVDSECSNYRAACNEESVVRAENSGCDGDYPGNCPSNLQWWWRCRRLIRNSSPTPKRGMKRDLKVMDLLLG